MVENDFRNCAHQPKQSDFGSEGRDSSSSLHFWLVGWFYENNLLNLKFQTLLVE